MSIKLTKHDIGADILSILTKGMYIDPRDALREYVQNGIDAGAKNIEIKVRGDAIVIEDDGCGMDQETMKKAVRVGISDKTPNVDVGFRGIGIYSSFHLCDTLQIYSRSESDSSAYLLTFNFREMRFVLQQQQAARLKGQLTGDQLMDLQSLLEKYIGFKALKEKEFARKAGTRVEMLNLDPNFFKPLTKFEEVADYLREVVPLHFHPEKFKWSKEIESRISSICKEHSAEFKLVNLTLQVNTQIERLYRPYTDDCFDEEPLKPQFEKVKSDGDFFGVAWGCLNPIRRKISDRELRGFLIRKQGFAIGKRISVAKYFRRTTYFDRYIGEIIVVHSSLLPNAARTDFEMSPLRILFYEALSKIAEKYNQKADEYQEYTKGDEVLDKSIKRLKEIEANISFSVGNAEQLIDIIVEVRNIHDQIESRLNRNVLREERIEEAKTVVKSAKELEKEIQRFISKAKRITKVKPKGKAPEVKSIERIKRLPEIKGEALYEKAPESLIEILNALDISISQELEVTLNLIDEKFIQASASNKKEYAVILKNLKDEIESLLAEE